MRLHEPAVYQAHIAVDKETSPEVYDAVLSGFAVTAAVGKEEGHHRSSDLLTGGEVCVQIHLSGAHTYRAYRVDGVETASPLSRPADGDNCSLLSRRKAEEGEHEIRRPAAERLDFK